MASANEMPSHMHLSHQASTKGATTLPSSSALNPAATHVQPLTTPTPISTSTTTVPHMEKMDSPLQPNGNTAVHLDGEQNGFNKTTSFHEPTPSTDKPNSSLPTTEPESSAPPITTPVLEKEPPDLDFAGNIDVNDDLPSSADLARAGELLILDADGQSRQFKELYTSTGVAPRQLIIFIRHFFCGNCQEYLRTLSASVTPDSLLSLDPPTFISVIGCGSPSLIPMYATATSCPFPIYAEPTRKLYDYLGMTRTLDPGSRKPEYMKRGMVKGAVKSIWQGISTGREALKGGDFKQVGGEFLFEEGQCVTVHRMRNTRDHLEIEDVRALVGLGEEEVDVEGEASDGTGEGKKRFSLTKERERQGKRSSSWGRVRAASWKKGAVAGDKEKEKSPVVVGEEKVLQEPVIPEDRAINTVKTTT